MEIIWHDKTCFEIKDKQATLFINPHRGMGRIRTDVVLSSLEEDLAEMESDCKIFDWPGEYELKEIPINAFQAWTKSKNSEKEGEQAPSTIIFCFEIAGIKFCHLGELGHTLTSEMVNEIGDVDILMIKVGKDSNLDSKKVIEIIEAIEPRIIMPMGSNDPSEGLKNLGADQVEKLDKFVIKSTSELPDSQMKYVMLNRA